MMLLERLVALVPGTLLIMAAGSLLGTAIRAEHRAALQITADRPVGEAGQVLQALVDRRAPGASVRPLPGGVGLRVIRAEGTACADGGAGTIRFRRRAAVRAPLAGDSLLHRAAEGAWASARIDDVGAATCADGGAAWLLTLASPLPTLAGAELLIVEWLDVGLSAATPTALAVRPLGASARQPAVGPLPAGSVRLELLDEHGVVIAPGSSAPAVVLRLSHAAPRLGSARLESRIMVPDDES